MAYWADPFGHPPPPRTPPSNFPPRRFSANESRAAPTPRRSDTWQSSSAPARAPDAPKRGRLRVTVLEAHGLRRPSNFVRIRFPGKQPRSEGALPIYTQVETATALNNHSPRWNETLELHPVCYPDVKDYVCYVPVVVEVVEEGTGIVTGRDSITIADLSRGVVYHRTIECDEGELYISLQALDFGRTGMVVTVMSGSGLIADEGDVTVLLRHYGQVRRTVALPGPDPVWRQTFRFIADTQRSGDEVYGRGWIDVEAYSKQRYEPDRLIGRGRFDIEPLECTRTRRKAVRFERGQVTLEVTPLDFGRGPAEALPLIPEPHLRERDFPEYLGGTSSDAITDYESRFRGGSGAPQDAPPARREVPFPRYPADGPRSRGLSYELKFQPLAPEAKGRQTYQPADEPSQHPAGQEKVLAFGTLHMTVNKVVGLPRPMDCALRVQVDDKRIETATLANTTAPHFEETFKAYVRIVKGPNPPGRIGRFSTSEVRVALLDASTGQEVSSSTVALDDLYENKGTEVEGTLTGPDGEPAGQFFLTLKAVGFGKKCYKGQLKCRVVEALDLVNPAGEHCVALRLQDESHTTSFLGGGNPVWEEECVFHPEVFEKDGATRCVDKLHVALMGRDPEGHGGTPAGTAVVDLSALEKKRPKGIMVDVSPSGTIRLEFEAKDFGASVADEGAATTAVADAQPPPPLTPGFPLPASATAPQPLSNGPKYFLPPPPAEDEEKTIKALHEELRQVQDQRSGLEQRCNADLDPLWKELNVLRAQADRALLEADRLRSPGRPRHRSAQSTPDPDPVKRVSAPDARIHRSKSLQQPPSRDPWNPPRRPSDRWAPLQVPEVSDLRSWRSTAPPAPFPNSFYASPSYSYGTQTPPLAMPRPVVYTAPGPPALSSVNPVWASHVVPPSLGPSLQTPSAVAQYYGDPMGAQYYGGPKGTQYYGAPGTQYYGAPVPSLLAASTALPAVQSMYRIPVYI